jgi:hypothetical protein
VPVFAGVPPNELNKFPLPPEQIEAVPLTPGFAGETRFTVTVVDEGRQGAAGLTVYVYTPAVFVLVLNVPKFPPLNAEGPVQTPVLLGEPLMYENKLNELPEAQKLGPLPVPAV